MVAKHPRGRLFPQDNNHSGSRGFHSSRVDAGCLLSLINGGYASLIAWLPAFYIEIGASAQYSGSLLALMTLGQAAGALLMPAMARHQDRRKLLLLALALQLVGFCGFIWLPLQLPVLWAMRVG